MNWDSSALDYRCSYLATEETVVPHVSHTKVLDGPNSGWAGTRIIQTSELWILFIYSCRVKIWQRIVTVVSISKVVSHSLLFGMDVAASYTDKGTVNLFSHKLISVVPFVWELFNHNPWWVGVPWKYEKHYWDSSEQFVSYHIPLELTTMTIANVFHDILFPTVGASASTAFVVAVLNYFDFKFLQVNVWVQSRFLHPFPRRYWNFKQIYFSSNLFLSSFWHAAIMDYREK